MTELKNIMFCATAFAPSLLGAKELPNIIYIVTDQQTVVWEIQMYTRRIWIVWHRQVFYLKMLIAPLR